MELDFAAIKHSTLFAGATEAEIAAMLKCLAATEERFEKNRYILRCGDSVQSLGLVLSGSVHVVREDFWGNGNILAEIGPGEVFAESYACTGEAMQVGVVAQEPTRVLFLNVQRILTVCPSACAHHTRLIQSLLAVLARQNLRLTRTLSHLSQRSTREKLLSYLSSESARQGGASFTIPFNRQQLADYLSVDRSAMSSELGRMQREGLLTFSKNSFTLHLPVEAEISAWEPSARAGTPSVHR